MEGPPFGRKTHSDAVRQYPRFRKKPLHNIAVQLGGDEVFINIANISLGGIGLFMAADEHVVEVDAKVTIGKDVFKARVSKVYAGVEVSGFSFVEPSAELQKSIEQYFQTEILALKLNRVETIPDRNNKQDKVIFFHGQNNCELLINERNSQICYFSIVILGNSIEVDPKKSLQVGEKIEDKNMPKRDGVFLFRPQKATTHMIESGIRFIDGIEDLDNNYKQTLTQMIRELSTPPSTSTSMNKKTSTR